MQRDLRDTPLFKELEGYVTRWLRPGSGQVRDAIEHTVSSDGRWLAFTGRLLDRLVGAATTRICIVELSTRQLRVVTFGPNTDRAPQWSPDGQTLYFLSDRDVVGQFQPYALDIRSDAARALPRPPGWVEYLKPSPDGSRLLLGVAGVGADLSGAQGGIAAPSTTESLPTWVPIVETGDEAFRWRSVYVMTLASGELRRASPDQVNSWEACWCGPDAIAMVASDRPDEAAWYSASLRRIDLVSGATHTLHTPAHQLGWPTASPDGSAAAVVEAVCSDRWIVAGVLTIVTRGGVARAVDTRGVDVTWAVFAADDVLMYAGVRGFETVVGRLVLHDDSIEELWSSGELTIGSAMYPDFAALGADGYAFIATAQGFLRPPAIVHGEGGALHPIRSFALDAEVDVLDGIRVSAYPWSAPDGLGIQGWLLRPAGDGPHPVVMDIHGGPVWCYRPRYLGTGVYWLALLRRGYAVFLPNPRGSSGRGQEYASRVFGDMGGADTHDYLSGIDRLVADGIADPTRLGVMGGSYGGYMTSWLVTQDTRFAAAVPMSPVTDWLSEHLTSHIPHFCTQFLADEPTNFGGRYYTRSPVIYAQRVKTPTLSTCGALDRNTPAGQAMEFHHALQLQGVESVLVTYPLEGHGVRTYPAVFDFYARIVGWFERHMPGPVPPA